MNDEKKWTDDEVKIAMAHYAGYVVVQSMIDKEFKDFCTRIFYCMKSKLSKVKDNCPDVNMVIKEMECEVGKTLLPDVELQFPLYKAIMLSLRRNREKGGKK